MTVTLTPFGDLLAVEHWSTRSTVALTPDQSPAQMREALIGPLAQPVETAQQRLGNIINPEMYIKGAPSIIGVNVYDCELIFNRAIPGRPDHDATFGVDLPALRQEGLMLTHSKKITNRKSLAVMPVRKQYLSHVILDDMERAMVLAQVHFRLLEADRPELALRGGSADYSQGIVVTADGRNGSTLWWIGQAHVNGVKTPTAKKLDARFTSPGELVLTPRQKQVS